MLKNLLFKLVSKTSIYQEKVKKLDEMNKKIGSIIKLVKKISKSKDAKEIKKLCNQIIKGEK